MERLAASVTDTLKQLADDVTSLEVRTYVSDDISAAVDQRGGGHSTELKAWTKIALDGDTQAIVPRVDGRIDHALWKVHM